MFKLLVCVATVGLVSADVSSLGYQYYKPAAPFQGSASSSQYNVEHNNANGYYSQNAGYPSGLNSAFQNTGNSVYHQISGGNQGYQGYKPAIFKGDSSSSGSSFQNTVNKFQNAYNTGNVYKGSSAFHGASSGNYANQNSQSYQVQQSQQAQVFKHFYVHAAPEDEEPAKPRTPIVLPPPQKHYKIIFIKAPTQHAGAPQVVPVPQQNEEKTIVYVLVNKPEDAQNIVLPKVEQKPPTKPEVYFIKYNSKEGSQAVIDNIVKDYNSHQSGVSVTNIGTGVAPPSALLGSLGASGAQIINGGAGSLGTQNTASSDYISQTSQSSYESQPLAISSGISDGTLTSTIVETGNSGTYQVDNGFNAGSAVTGFDSGSSGTVFNSGSSGNVFNSGSSGTGSSSNGFNSAGGAVLNGESSGSGFSSSTNSYNSGSNGIEYSTVGGISSTGVSQVSDSEYKGSSISTSQGLPHETYGVPKFSV